MQVGVTWREIILAYEQSGGIDEIGEEKRRRAVGRGSQLFVELEVAPLGTSEPMMMIANMECDLVQDRYSMFIPKMLVMTSPGTAALPRRVKVLVASALRFAMLDRYPGRRPAGRGRRRWFPR